MPVRGRWSEECYSVDPPVTPRIDLRYCTAGPMCARPLSVSLSGPLGDTAGLTESVNLVEAVPGVPKRAIRCGP